LTPAVTAHHGVRGSKLLLQELRDRNILLGDHRDGGGLDAGLPVIE
jgi:hypothetical protein